MGKGLLFTYLLTYGGVLAAFYRPYYGLLAYVALAMLCPESLWYWAVPEGHRSRIVAICLLLSWAIHGFGNWRLARARGPLLFLVGFLLWATILVSASADEGKALVYVEVHAKIVLPFLVGITTITSVHQLKQLAWVIVLCLGYVAFEFNLSYFQGYNRLQDAPFNGADNNGFAIILDSSIGLAFFLGLYARRWWQKAVALGCALLMAHAVMFSFSRGGLLGLIVTAVVAFVVIPKRLAHVVVFAIAVIVGLRLAGPEVVQRFSGAFAKGEERDRSANLRVLHWQACAESMLRNPLGVGPNQWRLHSPSYGLPAMDAHSFWLQTGAELGFPGLVLIAAFYGVIVVRLWPLARGRDPTVDPWLPYLARMVVSSLVGFAVSSQFVSVWGVDAPFYVALLGVGTIKVASLDRAAQPQGVSVYSTPRVAISGFSR